VFLGAPLLAKGYQNQARQVAWAALAHNLWLLTGLPVKPKTHFAKPPEIARPAEENLDPTYLKNWP
jgi:hypothetical protein